MKQVSIIVPVYNVEKYLRKCIDNIINQTYKNLEIILVNDGSTDESGKICDEYATKDDRIQVIHKANGGLSSARNAGLDICVGDYITCVDSDDYLNLSYVEKSMNLCEEFNADISIMRFLRVNDDTNEDFEIVEENKTYIFSPEEAIKESLYQKLFACNAWSKLYKRETIKDIRYPFGCLSEDLAVCHLILSNANKVVFSTEIGYYYRLRPFSITTKSFTDNHMDALGFALDIEDYCKKHYPKLQNAAKCRTFNVATHLLFTLPDTNKDDKKYYNKKYYNKITKEIKRTRFSVICNKDSRVREKAAAALSYCGTGILKKAWNSRFAVKNHAYESR